MEKKQKQIIIIAVLIAVLTIAWSNTFFAIRKRSGASRVTKPPTIVSSVSDKAITHKTEEPVVYPKEENLEWVRCPFSGKIYSSYRGEVSDLKLEGILWDKDKPQAIIDNSVVDIGDSIGSHSVVEISQDRVVLTDGSTIFELKLEK